MLTVTRRGVIGAAAGLAARAEPTRIAVRGTTLQYAGARLRCAVGWGGIRADKREGDGATPTGTYELREIFYRPDRRARPAAFLPVRALSAADGWCDAPGDPGYNRFVTLPYPAHHEALWREDRLYDLLAVIGFNDAPVVPGRGSAIFLHIASPGWSPTDGCVALAPDALETLLAACPIGTVIDIA
jgi:L,D-peptidoglycan transpeptidase YkuD (ErfK/YbiS/YcfS/YnhG family)